MLSDPSIAAPPRANAPSIRGALASLSLCLLLSSLGSSIANVGLPTLAQVFGTSFQAVQWVVLAYLLAVTTVIVSVGRLGDLIGRRRLLLVGLGLFTAASGLCAWATTLDVLIAARAVQGLGAAVMMALSLALVGEAVPKAQAGAAMGLLGTMSAVGTALGPTLGGLLIASFGWPALFLVTVPLGLVALLGAVRYLPIDGPRSPAGCRGFDPLGVLLLALTLAAYALAMTFHATLLFVAALGLAFFVVVESRVAAPLIRLSLLREPALAAGLLMSALVSTVVMGTLVMGPFYLARALGLQMAQVGLVMSVGPLVAALGGVPAGRSVDRFGAARMTLAGLLLMAAGCLALSLLPTAASVAGYLLPIAVVTAGYALFQAANNTAIMAGADAAQRGLISGLLSLSRNLGLITGASAMGTVFSLASRADDLAAASPAALAFGMRLSFAVAAGLIGCALAVRAWSRSKP